MKISKTSPAMIASHTIDSAPQKPQKPKSALRSLMQPLGLAFLACTLVLGAIGCSASASGPADEAAVRTLGDTFAKAFVQKNADSEHPYSRKTEPS